MRLGRLVLLLVGAGNVAGASQPVSRSAVVMVVRRPYVTLSDPIASQRLAALAPSPSPIPSAQPAPTGARYIPRPCGPPTCGYYGRLIMPTGHINTALEY